MNTRTMRVVTLAVCLSAFTHAAYAQAREASPPATTAKPIFQAKRLDGVAIERKQSLATMDVVQRNEIEADLKKLIDADPLSTLSVEEFRFVVGVQQWAIAQHKRIRFIDALEARRAALTTNKTTLKGQKDIAPELAAIEDKLNTLGEDAQLANIDLRNNLQKMQQALQMMSNMSKSMHDTAKSVIQKIG